MRDGQSSTDEGTNEAQINSDKPRVSTVSTRRRVFNFLYPSRAGASGKKNISNSNFIKLKSSASTSAFAVEANENET